MELTPKFYQLILQLLPHEISVTFGKILLRFPLAAG